MYERLSSDLSKVLQSEGSHFSAMDRLNVAIDVARGLTYMHGQESNEQVPILTEDTTSVIDTADPLPVAAVMISSRANHGMANNPIWHRDIKSANIGLTSDTPRRAKLLDCGISKSRSDISKTMMTVTGGSALGTPGYIAPEVMRTGKYGTRSEVYSFGVVLLELLASKHATVRNVSQ